MRFIFYVLIYAVLASPGSAEEPKHILLAREFVKNLKPENNSYSNDNRNMLLPGEGLFNREYKANIDCIGFVEEILFRSYRIYYHFPTKEYKDRYTVSDFVRGVESGSAPKQVSKVQDLVAGDILAWKLVNRSGQKHTGHIMFVDTPPRLVVKKDHRAHGFNQWEVWIIDSSEGPMSPDDARIVKKLAHKEEGGQDKTVAEYEAKTGVGRGRLFLLSDEEGHLKGILKPFKRARVQMHDDRLHFVMAHPEPP